MKILKIAGVFNLILLCIFTTLYFTHPRKVEIEKIVEILPDSLNIKFVDRETIKYDTVFQTITVRDTVPVTNYASRTETIYDTVYIYQDPDQFTITSSKTFLKDLISEKGQMYGKLRSTVSVIAPCKAIEIRNDITLIPLKEVIAADIAKHIQPESDNLIKGIVIGSGAVIAVGAATALIVR